MQNPFHSCQAIGGCSGHRTEVSSSDTRGSRNLGNELVDKKGGRASGPSGLREESNLRSHFPLQTTAPHHSLASCSSAPLRSLPNLADALQRWPRDQVQGEHAFWAERDDVLEQKWEKQAFVYHLQKSGTVGSFLESMDAANCGDTLLLTSEDTYTKASPTKAVS